MGVSRGDLVLYGRALRGRWPIPDQVKVRVVAELMHVLTTGKNRERIRAAQTLVQIDRLNLVHERFLLDQLVAREVEDLQAKIDALGGGDMEASTSSATATP